MKKTASSCLLLIMVFSALTPVFSQKARRVRLPAVPDEFARFERVEALSAGAGVLIRWQMISESGNAGFQVYRRTDTGTELVNTSLITGAILKPGDPNGIGGEYEFFDDEGTFTSAYLLESVSLGGRSVWTEVFNVRQANGDAADERLGTYSTAIKPNDKIRSRVPTPGPELQQIIEDNLLPPDIDTHRWVVGQPGAKIAVRKNGFYRVTRAQLEAAGFNVNSPVANWRLFMEGNEQAIIVEENGQYIEFLGRAVDTVESDTRIYYLITDDLTAGKRVQVKIVRPLGGTVVSNNYPLAFELRERAQYNGRIKNGDLENYWGRTISIAPPVPSQQVKFNLSGVDLSVASCTVTIRLQGLQGSTHSVRAILNGQELGFITGTGNTNYSAAFLVNTAFLIEGENSLALNEAVSGVASYFDRVTVDYRKKYLAEQNTAVFATPGYRRVNVTGFTSPDARLFETTFDGNPILISGHTIVPEGATYTVRIPSARPMMMHALADSAILGSPSVTANVPSDLYSSTNRADMIILSHSPPDFLAAAQTWANYRSSAGGGSFVTKVVDIADVFDEFNYGVSSAASVNAFLRRAYEQWQSPAPAYVLLLGDSSYDARNYEGFGYFNHVPSKMVNLLFDESPSDDALADFNGDGLSEMAIGRIATRTVFGINTALTKTMVFETRDGQSFDRGTLFVADQTTAFNDFHGMNLQMASQLPPSWPRMFVDRGLPPLYQVPDPNAQANLIAALNSGKYVVNYSGHGSAGTWGGAFFTTANVPQLTNASRPSIFAMLTCLNGYFIRPKDVDSCLSERLMTYAGGGSVVSWSSSTETTADFQLIMGTRFFRKLGEQNIHRMGDLIRDAKTVLPGNSDVRLSWVLLGDPALQVVYIPS